MPGCRAGKAFFNIDSTGDVAICVERKASPVANLFRDSIRTILRRLRAAARSNACRGCWYNCRGEIESLYRPMSLACSLPTLLFDRGRAKSAPAGPLEVNLPAVHEQAGPPAVDTSVLSPNPPS